MAKEKLIPRWKWQRVEREILHILHVMDVETEQREGNWYVDISIYDFGLFPVTLFAKELAKRMENGA